MGVIKSVTKTIFTTTDGAEFDDATLAEGHQAGLDATPIVEAFIVSEHADSKDRHRGTLRKLLASWEAFKVRYDSGDKAETAPAGE